jgi:putative ABC transport system permease protein
VIDDPLVFLAQPDSIILTKEFARRNGISTGAKIPLQTMDGMRQFTVRGLMASTGLASAFGGNLAIMDIYAAQKVFGRGRTFDRIDLAVKEGVAVDAARAALEKRLGPGFQVESPAARGKQFESIARLFSIAASINSVFALLIGLFIIYNTFSIAVTQRRSEIGILRALGAGRGQIRALFLTESMAMGLAGSVIGVLFGLLLARAMATYLSSFLGEVYGVAQRAETIAANPKLIALALFIGVFTSMVAAWAPARAASQVDPVHALQKGAYQAYTGRENRVRQWTAIGLVVVTALTILIGRGAGLLFYTGYASIVAAALLLTPASVRMLIRWMRPALRWVRPVEGALAADSLLQAPRRTSATVAALMLSLALVIGLGGVAKASYASILDWLSNSLNPDLFVGTNENISDRSYRFPPEIGEQMRAIEGVDEVQFVRTARVNFRGNPTMLVATDLASLVRRTQPKMFAGEREQAYRLASEGKGFIASDNLALMHKLKLGDDVEIPTPSGILKLPITGIVLDYSDQQGALIMEREVYIRYFKDDSAVVFRVYLKKGFDPEDAKRRILERFSGERRLFVLTNAQVREFVMRVSDQWFGITYMQIFVAVLVAILGIVNSLTVSITDRRRELGVLQAVGALRNQIRHTIWMEAAAIGAVGLALGFVLGGVMLYYYLTLIRVDLAGLRLDYEYPFQIAMILIPVMLAAALISALGPAEKAIRGSLVEALEYE